MYIYKRQKNKCHLIDYVASADEFVIEERLLKIIRKEKDLQDITSVKSKYNGLYTVYYFGGTFALLTCEYLLNEDGTVKTQSSLTAV